MRYESTKEQNDFPRATDYGRPSPFDDPIEEQKQELRRATDTIALEVIAYCRSHFQKEITMANMQSHVAGRIRTTQCIVIQPSSIDRVFRDLRQRGLIFYTCVSRSKSLYRIDGIVKDAEVRA